MNPNFIPLEEIRIARPCRADWQNMTGDERARFCGSCHKHVYDLSQMTREAAQNLIAEKEGDVCVRLHRRPDGTVMTSDCPVGKREVMRPLWWTVAGFVALLASGAAVQSQPSAPVQYPVPATQMPLVERARSWPLVGAVVNRVSPPPIMMMGEIAPVATGKPAAPPKPKAKTKIKPKPKPTAAPLLGRIDMGAPLPPKPKGKH